MKKPLRKIICLIVAAWYGQYAYAQTCSPRIREITPTEQFVVDTRQGLVLDKNTGLMWKQCLEGYSGFECSDGIYELYDWQNALLHAQHSEYAGYTDWRLPNVKELESLIEERCRMPAINQAVFPNSSLSNSVWSSTPYANYDDYAWRVSFQEGDTYYATRSERLSIRLVRDVSLKP